MRVAMEEGKRRVFACALEWPGWARSGKTEETALGALLAYHRRYDDVVREAGLTLPDVDEVEVVERVTGSGATDFGVPDKGPRGRPGGLERRRGRSSRPTARRGVAHARRRSGQGACGPAQGTARRGRDRVQVVEHVIGAEQSYARSIGVRFPPARLHAEGVGALREEVVTALRQAAPALLRRRRAGRRVTPPAASPGTPLDHAWEIEDKSEG